MLIENFQFARVAMKNFLNHSPKSSQDSIQKRLEENLTLKIRCTHFISIEQNFSNFKQNFRIIFLILGTSYHKIKSKMA